MSRNWTQAQLSAIQTQGRTLLVSAAAGSGKTATLTERIIQRITDSQNPGDLSRMLIVTFTKAAASELKQRISQALSDAIAADPTNRHLQSQLIHLGSAPISTIDAFCYQPVKEHFAESGMPASFRIADVAELQPMQDRIMNETINAFYERYATELSSDSDDEIFSILKHNIFADLCDSLSSFKNDENITVTLNKLYQELLNFPDGIRLLKLQAECLTSESKNEFFTSCHGKQLFDWTKNFCKSSLAFYQDALLYISDDPVAVASYGESLKHDFEFFQKLDLLLQKPSYSQVRLLIHNHIPKGFITKRGHAKDYSDLKKRRSKIHGDLNNFRESLYAFTAETLAKDMRHLAALAEVLFEFYDTFDKALTEEKLRRGICDFSDNRRRLLAMLQNPDGSPSPLSQSYLENFDEVYIDEYQDVDELQDTIFRLIGGNHRFMVGDIKQSIYGFRGADPTVFSRYRQDLPSLEEGFFEQGNSIFMSDNFRCDESVIRVTNGVCSHMFEVCPETVGYLPMDDLGFSKKCPEGYHSPRVHIAMLAAGGKNEEPGPFKGTDAEATYVANQIAHLLSSRQTLASGHIIQPKDIAILMRDTTQMNAYMAALSAAGIPTGCEDMEKEAAKKDLFHGADMIYLLNLLRVINHPNNDVPLSEILRCDFPGFSLDQLITLRHSAEKNASLFEALEGYTEAETPDPDILHRTTAFLSWLNGYRSLCTTLTAEELLRKLRSDSCVQCRDSKAFRFLYESARTCRVSSFVGIYTFLHYIESKILNEKKVTLTENTSRPGGVVTLMTIHASKGLEFPVCFVARCGNSKRDKLFSADLVFEKSTGVSLKFYNREEHRKYDNGLRRIAAQIRLNQEKEEEMRILYVAMTRAREYLYLVGFKSDTRAPFVKGDRFNALTAGSYMEWIRAGMQAHPEILPYCDVQEVSENSIERVYVQIQDASEEIAADFSAGMEKYRQLHRMRAEISPIEELLRSVPTKVPASRMTDMLLDECVYYTSDLSAGDEDKIPVSERMAPLFDIQSKENIRRSLMLMSHGSSSDEFELLLKANSRPTAAEKGTAAHMFLQYCNWKAVYERGLEEEICRLREAGFITERIVTILDRKQLAAFFESDFAKRAYTATHMERELKFQRFIPLRTQTTHQALADALGDRTLYVRGSIDLLCEYSDGRLEICDYKTDHITREERENRDILIAHLREKHLSQLKQYAAAMEEMYGKRPDKVYIFSLALGEAVEITMNN